MLLKLADINKSFQNLNVLPLSNSSSMGTSTLIPYLDGKKFRERDNGRSIPRHVWIASCKLPSPVPSSIQSMIDRNKLWTFHVVSCAEQEAFIGNIRNVYVHVYVYVCACVRAYVLLLIICSSHTLLLDSFLLPDML